MAVTRRSLALLRELRAEVGQLADDAVRQVAQAWLDAWERLTPTWQRALAAVVDTATRTGRWPPAWQIARIPEVAAATTAAEQEAGPLAELTATVVVGAAMAAIAASVLGQPRIMATQLPTGTEDEAATRFAGRVLPSPLDVIRHRCTQQITALSLPLSEQATQAMKQALVRGVRVGASPSATADDMLARVNGAFAGGRTRAVNIARTEILDAHRISSAYVHEANADVLSGWTWICACDRRSCSACWALHGTTWPLDHPGPLGHQSCRCSRAPVAKPWRELGIGGNEPDRDIPSAEKRFRALPKADQLMVMGPARHALWAAGDVAWADLATLRTTAGWRDSYTPRTVAGLRRLAGIRPR